MNDVKLKYGDPPNEKDCTDNGELVVPSTLEISLDAETQQREIGIMDLFGTKLSPWSRARFAVRKLEQKGGNQKVRVKGLGTVIVGHEGWEVKQTES